MKPKLTKFLTNFFAVISLIVLLLLPFYFSNNFAKVAGVKTSTPYLLISQIEKFPNLKFSQENDIYRVSFTKIGSSQFYSAIFIINNPTNENQKYAISRLSGKANLFFSSNPEEQITTITLAPSSSIPLSLLSPDDHEFSQDLTFQIKAK